MKYKLLVLDVDGTLLNNQKEISPRTLAARRGGRRDVQLFWLSRRLAEGCLAEVRGAFCPPA